jgi:hypothetical protein
MNSVRSRSPRQRLALAFASRASVAALAAWLMACSSGSPPVGAGTDGGAGPPGPAAPDSGSEAHADGASDASLSCTPIGYSCESFDVCCAGGTCLPAGPGGAQECVGPDSGPGVCLTAGQPCSSTESCCNGSANCGEGTTNTCE